MTRALHVSLVVLLLGAGLASCARKERSEAKAEAAIAAAPAASAAKEEQGAGAKIPLPRAVEGKPAPAEPVVYRTTAPADSREVRFRPLHIELEVEQPVSVWQVELVVVAGDARIVGVEGGTAEGFREPPYYDSAALLGGRIVLAAFNTHVSLPAGRHRVATVHVREEGGSPTYELRLAAAAGPEGAPAAARAVLVMEEGAKP